MLFFNPARAGRVIAMARVQADRNRIPKAAITFKYQRECPDESTRFGGEWLFLLRI